MATRPWYVTRGRVKRVLDIAETARRNADVDDAIEAASINVEGLLHRRFYPRAGTERFDWPPSPRTGNAYRLRLDDRELASSSGLTVTTDNGATTLTAGQYLLKPEQGPPYTTLEINLGDAGSLSSSTTHQRAVAITAAAPYGFGYQIDDRRAGALAANISSTSATTCAITDSSVLDVGSILLCDSERMIVTGRLLLTTGQTLLSSVDSDAAGQSLSVTDGTSFFVGEMLTIGSERVRIDDIAGNTLIVERAVDGSTLAAHTSGTTIYAPRTLTIERGSLGTTAATHTSATALYYHAPPAIVAALTTAYALNQLLQQGAGYARVSGSGDNQKEFTGRGVRELEADAIAAVGRKLRRYAGV